MDREVNTKTTLLVMSFFVLLIALWTHFNTQALLVDAPSFAKQHPNGNLFFQLGSDYYEVTSQGQDVHHFSLDSLGIKQTIGDFDFFGNGDLLIYVSDYQPSFLENLATFRRKPGNESQSASEGEGFYRCNVYQHSCDIFGSDLPVFKRGFRLAIDKQDNVYIADTSRHRLIMVDSTGNKVDSLDKGLEFPNGMRWVKGSLWLVNTNHHEVIQLNPDSESLGKVSTRFNATQDMHRFPSDLAPLESSWLVLVMNNSMQNGKLVQFSPSGSLLKAIDLERGADVVSLLATPDKIILPDVKHLRYRSLNTSTFQEIGDFESESINAHLSGSRDSVWLYNTICWLIVGIGALGFITLAVVAIKSEVRHIDNSLKSLPNEEAIILTLPEGLEEYWLPKSKQFVRLEKSQRTFLIAGTFLSAAPFLLYFSGDEHSAFVFLPGLLIGAIMYFNWRLFKAISKMGLGLNSHGILIRNHLGSISAAKGDEISVSSSTIMTANALVTTRLFDSDEFEKWIKPLLNNASKVSEIQAMSKQWQLRHPGMLEPLKMILVMFFVLGLMELAS